MTDGEIIKALACCVSQKNSCNGCPMHTMNCTPRVPMAFALNLINRQKAKIEALQMDNQQLQSDIANANMNADHALAEIERLEKHEIQEVMKFNNDTINRVTNEAVKEFAERLRERYAEYDDYDDIYAKHIRNDIDSIEEEMGVEG